LPRLQLQQSKQQQREQYQRQFGGSCRAAKPRPPSFGTGPSFCHPDLDLSCRNFLATKTRGSLFRSVRASKPLPPNTHVYFEFHVSQLARRRSQDDRHSASNDLHSADHTATKDIEPETVISVGVALDEMPLNVPVGTSLSSIGFQSGGQIVTSSQLVKTLSHNDDGDSGIDGLGFGCGDTIGVLAHVAVLSLNQESTRKSAVVSVDFFVNGRPVHTHKPVSVEFQGVTACLNIFPTLSILSESTFVLGLFSAADLRFPPSASQVLVGTTVYALDGATVVVGEE
jgi:hypothetical protein